MGRNFIPAFGFWTICKTANFLTFTKTNQRHMNNEIMGKNLDYIDQAPSSWKNCGHTSLQPFCIYVGCSLLAKYLSEVWIWEHPKAYDCSSHRIDQLEEVNILPLFSKKGQRIIRSFNFWDISFRNISRKIRNISRKIKNISNASRNFSHQNGKMIFMLLFWKKINFSSELFWI